jgi:hypothetical protein
VSVFASFLIGGSLGCLLLAGCAATAATFEHDPMWRRIDLALLRFNLVAAGIGLALLLACIPFLP